MNEALHPNYLHVKSMQRHDRQSCDANYAAQIERLKIKKNLTLADIHAALTNQELALAVT